MDVEILMLVLSGVIAYIVWLSQRRHSAQLIRRALYLDIISFRSKLYMMEQFFENAKKCIQEGDAFLFYHEKTDFSFYKELISQIPVLNVQELDVVKGFYDYYFTMEHEMIALSDTMRQWKEIKEKGESVDRKRIVVATFNVERLLQIRRMLYEKTQGSSLLEFKSSYGDELSVWSKKYRNALSKQDTEFLDY